MIRRSCPFLLTACLLARGVLFAQQVNDTSISPDDPELYFGFFALCQSMQAQIGKEPSAEARASMQHGAAAYFNVSETDFATIVKIGEAVLGKTSDIRESARAYFSTEVAAGRAPDHSRLVEFQQQRVSALQQGASSMRRALSPHGWETIHSFINNTYRMHVTRKEISDAR
jgi:hypothetical protein